MGLSATQPTSRICDDLPLWDHTKREQSLYPREKWPSCPWAFVAWLALVFSVIASQLASIPWLNKLSLYSKAHDSGMHNRLQDNSTQQRPHRSMHRDLVTNPKAQMGTWTCFHWINALSLPLEVGLKKETRSETFLLFLKEKCRTHATWALRSKQWTGPFAQAHRCFLLLTTASQETALGTFFSASTHSYL